SPPVASACAATTEPSAVPPSGSSSTVRPFAEVAAWNDALEYPPAEPRGHAVARAHSLPGDDSEWSPGIKQRHVAKFDRRGPRKVGDLGFLAPNEVHQASAGHQQRFRGLPRPSQRGEGSGEAHVHR